MKKFEITMNENEQFEFTTDSMTVEEVVKAWINLGAVLYAKQGVPKEALVTTLVKSIESIDEKLNRRSVPFTH